MTITVRALLESELSDADRIFRVAFGTQQGAEMPESFAAGSDYVASRWSAEPLSAFAALVDGELVGTNFVARWGSFGYLGPLTVDPSRWNTGVGQRLLEATVARLDEWDVRLAGLYTFAESVKHVGLYQRFGFWPRALTQLCVKPVGPGPGRVEAARLSELGADDLPAAVEGCRQLTGRIYEGLDLTREVRAVIEQDLGDVLLIGGLEEVEAFAVCHLGEGSEAGPDLAYVKFGAADSEEAFRRLLLACENLATECGLKKLLLGVSTARTMAWRVVREMGFVPRMQGIAMHRPNRAGFNHREAWVVDDWR